MRQDERNTLAKLTPVSFVITAALILQMSSRAIPSQEDAREVRRFMAHVPAFSENVVTSGSPCLAKRAFVEVQSA